MQIVPRDYQQEALDAMNKGRRGQQGLRQLVALPTGAGKTIVGALDIKRVVEQTGKGAIFMAHRDELITQPAKKIPLVWPDATIGRVKAKDNELGRQVTVASVQTVSRPKRLAQLVEAQDYSLLYVDEAHHATAATYRRVIDTLCAANPEMVVVGLTATPVRTDATKMKEVFSEVTYHKSMLDLIEAGYLSDLQLQQVALDVSIDGVPRRQGDLKTSEIRKILIEDDIMGSMVQSWKKYAAPRRTIVFAVDVAHANRLAAHFSAHGVKATSIYGDLDMETRRERLEGFQSGKYDVIVNVFVLVEGYDDEIIGETAPLSCIMLARPTLSQSLYIQSVGRGTRLAPGKENCLILDFTYNTKRHHIVQLPHLFGLEEIKPQPRGEMGEAEEEKSIQSIVAAVRDAKEIDVRTPPPRANFRWPKSKHGHCLSIGKNMGYILIRPTDNDPKAFEVFHLDPIQEGKDYRVHRLSQPLSFDWAFGLAEDMTRRLYEARSYQGHSKTEHLQVGADWMLLDPTEGQLKILGRAGKKAKNRGEASDMITVLIVERIIEDRAKKRAGIVDVATPKQRRFLFTHSIPHESNITKREASRLIGLYKKKEQEQIEKEVRAEEEKQGMLFS